MFSPRPRSSGGWSTGFLPALARLELDDWTGHRFTDLITSLKLDAAWKITNKVLHPHAPATDE